MHLSDTVLILCTTPDDITAKMLAEKVLTTGLAACVTLLTGATSLYYWQGELQQEQEVQMLLKTSRAQQQALLTYLKKHHPYDVPELLVLPVIDGDNEYLSWLAASLR